MIEQQVGAGADTGERRLLALYRDLSANGKLTVERFTRFVHDEEHRFVQPELIGPDAAADATPSGPTLFDMPAVRP